MSTYCDDHCISCVSGDKEQKYKKWHVFSGNPILLQIKVTEQTSVPCWLPSSNQRRLPCKKKGQWAGGEFAGRKTTTEISLSLVGLSRMGVTPNWLRENTEVTLLKHASASNKHVCEVRSSAPISQHMFIAPEK